MTIIYVIIIGGTLKMSEPISLLLWSIGNSLMQAGGLVVLGFCFLAILRITRVSFNVITGAKLTKFLNGDNVYALCRKNDTPIGLICGMWYLAYVDECRGGDRDEPMARMWLLSPGGWYKKQFVQVSREPNEVEEVSTEYTITRMYVDRASFSWGASYNKSQLTIQSSMANCTEKQLVAVQSAIEAYFAKSMHRRTTKYHSVLLAHGVPRTGKSTLDEYITVELMKKHGCKNVIFATWNPVWQGNLFGNMYAHANPTKENPMILTLNEIDKRVKHVFEGKEIKATKSPIPISDGTDWNDWLDEIGKGTYPYLFVIMTTNLDVKCVGSGVQLGDFPNVSALRKDRVDSIIEFTEKDVISEDVLTPV